MIKIALVGDILMTRRLPEKGYDGLLELKNLINEHEVKFANLETTIHTKDEGYPSAFPGGTWVMTNPECLKDIKYFGFNLFNTANNHSMDYSHNGLFATMRYLQDNNMLFAGIGKNLADATAPTYIECSEGRVSLIGVTSSFHDSDAAGNQRLDTLGRPGINPLRHKSIYEVTHENYKALQKIADETGINDYHNQAIKEGYLLQKENFNFANFEFREGNVNRLITFPIEKDLNRIIKSVTEAKKQSDCIIVSIHSHQFALGNKQHPAEFIRLFAKACIDAGTSIVVGHGPHILRGIEIYKKGVIFYSLGNFVFQNETVSHLPADFYEKYSLQWDDAVGTAMDKRSKNGTIGLNTDPYAWKSCLVSIEYSNAKMKIKLFPIVLNYELPRYRRGCPKIHYDTDILQRLKDLSISFGTKINITKNGIGLIDIF
jgi:poly-gamma-glutamate synthesis protein (capsule biosynthesis protein)